MPTLQFPTSKTQFWDAMWAEQTLLFVTSCQLWSLGEELGLSVTIQRPEQLWTITMLDFR